jgi:hypothetical protein
MIDKKVEKLEKLLDQQTTLIKQLIKRIAVLERENKRRASEIASIPRK